MNFEWLASPRGLPPSVPARAPWLITALALAVLLASATPAAEAKKGKSFTGTNKADRINGTGGDDRINGKGGNDKLNGKGGKDKIKGGSGKDAIKGASGNEKVNAGSGNDKVAGGSGKDKLSGSSGKDSLKGGGSNDRLVGGTEADSLSGGGGKDYLDAADGAADRSVNGGGGADTCRVDSADEAVTKGCETVDVVDPPPPPPPPPTNRPLTVTQSSFECTPGGAECTFSAGGANADTANGTVAGGGGVSNVNGTATANTANGNWTAEGTAACTADGTLRFTFGTESATVNATCPPDEPNPDPLTVTQDNTSCLPPVGPLPSACTVALVGTGADESSGTVTADGGVTINTPIVAGAEPSGNWTANGSGVTCTADGNLTVTFGAETVQVPVDCPDGDGDDNGPLAVTAGDPVTCSPAISQPPLPPVPGACTIVLAGTGADADSGSITADGGVSNLTGPPPSASGGNWAYSGGASCTADGTLTVTFGSESVQVTVECPVIGGGGGGGGGEGPLAVTAGDPVTCTAAVSRDPLPPIPGVCTIALAGTGADTNSGTVTPGGSVSNVTGAPPSAQNGNWLFSGGASCTGNGTLTVTFGAESVVVTVNCPVVSGGGGGGGGNGPLAITAGSPVNCTPPVVQPPLPTIPGLCEIALVGSGADAASGTITPTGGVANVTGAPPSASGDGSWAATGGASCTADGALLITFGTESVIAPVNCGP